MQWKLRRKINLNQLIKNLLTPMGDRKGKSTDFLKKTQTFLTFLLVLL